MSFKYGHIEMVRAIMHDGRAGKSDVGKSFKVIVKTACLFISDHLFAETNK